MNEYTLPTQMEIFKGKKILSSTKSFYGKQMHRENDSVCVPVDGLVKSNLTKVKGALREILIDFNFVPLTLKQELNSQRDTINLIGLMVINTKKFYIEFYTNLIYGI